MGDSPSPALDGLRTLLDEWKAQGSTVKKQVSKDEHESSMASVYTQYQKMATQEDKDLVTSWTETLNILLTFAGLLSAIITAFLLASQSELQPPQNASTDKILLHISHQLDNTTNIRPSIQDDINQNSSIRVLAYWHASLGCSLLSAFGSLLSKQWVLHYQSSPVWVKTIQDECHLREVRVYGLSKWRMHAIIDSFPVLLQLSVFLFYVGLAESIHSTPTLFAITVTFAGTMATLYIVTLIAGAFSPSCPFKSPITPLPYKGARFVVYIWKALFGTVTLAVFAVIAPVFRQSPWREKSRYMIDRWVLVRSFWQRTDLRRDEQDLIKTSHGVAGVLFWWIQQSELDGRPNEVKINTVTQVVKSLPVDTALSMSTWRGELGDWCFRVFLALEESPTISAFLEVDAVCHMMHQSPKVVQAVRYGLAEYERHTAAAPDFYRYITKSIRKGWTRPSPNLQEPTVLPILDMQPTTFAVYLRFQILDWIHSEELESSLIHVLHQELTLALDSHYFWHPNWRIDPVVDAISTAAIVLVPKETPQTKPMLGLVNSEQPELLLQAFHRLSQYPHDQPPNPLARAVVAATTNVLRYIQIEGLSQSFSWKSGEFADSLYRLLRLGRIWWHAEVEDEVNSGSSLLYEMHMLMDLAVNQDIKVYLGGHSKLFSPTLKDLQELFATYARPDAPKSRWIEHSTEAVGLLDFALSLRYLDHPLPNPPRLVWSKTPSSTYSLEGSPQVIRQLIHDIETAPADSRLKLASLSVIVKGRDIFFPGPVSSLFPDLMSDINRLAEGLPQTDLFVYEMPRELYETFDRWEELVFALEELLRVLGHPKRQRQITPIEAEKDNGVILTPAPEEVSTTVQDPPSTDAALDSPPVITNQQDDPPMAPRSPALIS